MFDTQKQCSRNHEGRCPHLVTCANGDGLVAQGSRLIELCAGCSQGTVSLLYKVRNLGSDVFDQSLGGIDLVCHHAETFWQCRQLRFDLVDFLTQLGDGLFKTVQCMVNAISCLVQGVQDVPNHLSHLGNQFVDVANHAIDDVTNGQDLFGHAVHGGLYLGDGYVERVSKLVDIAMKAVNQVLQVL